MTNYWPQMFEENNRLSAKNLLEEQARLLPKLTGDMVYAEVSDMTDFDAFDKNVQNDFNYRFDILGKFLSNYRFNVCCFSHDITLYPVKFNIDEIVAKELNISRSFEGYIHSINDEEALKTFIGKVLTSERMKMVIGSIIGLSK